MKMTLIAKDFYLESHAPNCRFLMQIKIKNLWLSIPVDLLTHRSAVVYWKSKRLLLWHLLKDSIGLHISQTGFDLYTDHNSLIFIFDPLAVMPDLGQEGKRKVLRWAVRLYAYNSVCFHIRGEDNVWGYLLTRWSIPLTRRRLVTIPLLPTTFAHFF